METRYAPGTPVTVTLLGGDHAVPAVVAADQGDPWSLHQITAQDPGTVYLWVEADCQGVTRRALVCEDELAQGRHEDTVSTYTGRHRAS